MPEMVENFTGGAMSIVGSSRYTNALKMPIALALVVSTICLASCASQADDHPSVQVTATTISAVTGYKRANDGALYLNDVDGHNYKLTWVKSDSGVQQSARFSACLEDARKREYLRSLSGVVEAPPTMFLPSIELCSGVAGLSVPIEEKLPDATHFKVLIRVENIPRNLIHGQGTPIMGKAGGSLGGQIDLSGNAPNVQQVLKDVSECKDISAKDGVLDSQESKLDTMEFHHVSIQPMVRRFKSCLEQRSYVASLDSK